MAVPLYRLTRPEDAPLRDRLAEALLSDRFPPSWLLAGPGDVSLSLALHLTCALLCRPKAAGADAPVGPRPCGVCLPCRKVEAGNHPDVVTVDTQTGDGHAKRFRGVAADAWIKPGESDVKVYIFPSAGRITPIAQNTLLKLLEDPPPYAVFFLLCGTADELLPTVRSRCRVERLSGQRTVDSGQLNPEAVRFLDAVAGGELAAAEWAVKAAALKREEAVAALTGALSLLKPRDPGAPALHEAILDGIDALEGNSMIGSALMALAVRCTAGMTL